MTPMCDATTLEQVGYAIGVADCDGVVTIEYFDVDGVSEGGTLPTDWRPCVQGLTGPASAPTHETLTYAGTVDIDFGDPANFRTLSVSGNLTLTGSGYVAPMEVWLKLTESGGSSRTLAWPSDWVFVTTKPVSIAANKTILVHLLSYTAAATGVVAATQVQP